MPTSETPFCAVPNKRPWSFYMLKNYHVDQWKGNAKYNTFYSYLTHYPPPSPLPPCPLLGISGKLAFRNFWEINTYLYDSISWPPIKFRNQMMTHPFRACQNLQAYIKLVTSGFILFIFSKMNFQNFFNQNKNNNNKNNNILQILHKIRWST